MNEAVAKLVLLSLFVVGLVTVMEIVDLLWSGLTQQSRSELPNKWERMIGEPCQPHDRTGLPTSPLPPRMAGQ